MLESHSHRPYPLPKGPWVMRQTWLDLLFAHWPVPYEQLRALVPPQLQLDTYDGYAWIGIVPFRMEGIRPRGMPGIPYTSEFAELNVRTYVTAGDKPGVYFFSLDAASKMAVEAARLLFYLPYFHAMMNCEQIGEYITYTSRRNDQRGAEVSFEGSYKPVSMPFLSSSGSFEYWLTERYCLYSMNGSHTLFRGDIHHLPWRLQVAEADIEVNTMAVGQGIHVVEKEPVLHFAKQLDVLIWPLARVK
ncbi:YqjF family protein [Paenibacillus agricola]|uniref:YqjF family protein n=1 Tax=Paenibacillus agricola TaxID=2716264 RepID=UPI0035D4E0D4